MFFSLSRFILLFALLASAGFSQDSPPKARAVDDVKLKPGDTISMEVFGEPDLTTGTRVLKNGEIVFPLIDTVTVGGLTIREATARVRELYAAKYLRDPKVSLTVVNYAEQYFSVIGAVGSPGQFPMPQRESLDLAAALATAGGLTEVADRNKIVLTRASGWTSTYSASQAENGNRIKISPGDRVIVHKSDYVGKTVTILGQVRSPGVIPMPVNGELDIVAGMARAGGFTPLANSKKVSVNRNGKVTQINVREMTEEGERGFFLQPDDIVTVPERLF